MSKKFFGYPAIIASALIFGFTPVLATLSYREGNNGINMAFLRAAIPAPLFLAIAARSFQPSGKQLLTGIAAGMLSFGCTLLLYSSYEFISPGLATTLHFLYPLYVTAFNALRKRRPVNKATLIGLSLATCGIILFLKPDEMHGDITGYLLAFCSGLVYAFYILILEKESNRPLPLTHLMLIISLTGIVLCTAVGLLTGHLILLKTGKAWLYACLAALLTAVIGCVLFQAGVRKTGGTNAAIFSLLEPISSVLFSLTFLGDTLSLHSVVSCILILGGLAVVTLFNIRTGRRNDEK